MVRVLKGALLVPRMTAYDVAPAGALQESATCEGDAVAARVIETPLAFWDSVKFCPAIVSVADRKLAVPFVVNAYCTVPFPVPDELDGIETRLPPGPVAVQAQPVPAVTWTEPVPLAEETFA